MRSEFSLFELVPPDATAPSLPNGFGTFARGTHTTSVPSPKPTHRRRSFPVNRTGPLSIAALLFPVLLTAQQRAPEPSVANPITVSFAWIAAHYGGLLMTAFDSIPSDKYAYRPTPAQQSFGYIAQHLEAANYGLCERFGVMKHVTTASDALEDTVKAAWPKDTLVARLRASFTFCDAALAQLSDTTLAHRVPYGAPGAGASALPSRSLLLFVTDLAEHYSQVASYMRLIGLVPPSALPPRSRAAIDLPIAALSQYVGMYDLPPSATQDSPQFLLDVSLKDGALYVKPGARPALRFWPETATDFFVKERDVQVSFVKDASGSVTGLVLHASGEDRAAKKVR
jgi:uncharacterized damage-inducible protein DinB